MSTTANNASGPDNSSVTGRKIGQAWTADFYSGPEQPVLRGSNRALDLGAKSVPLHAAGRARSSGGVTPPSGRRGRSMAL